MRQLFSPIRSQIQYMVILPYLGLMVLVMLLGSGIAITLVADNWQERFDNQLGQVARNFTETFAQREIGNITYLGQIAFTAPNQANGAPSIVDSISQRNINGLELSLKGLWQLGQSNESVNQDRLIVFDKDGISLTDWERSPINPNEPIRYIGTDLSQLPLVQAVLQQQQTPISESDLLGDKFSGLIAFRSTDGSDNLYFFTVAPVFLPTGDESRGELVGGLLVAQRLDTLLPYLQIKSQSAISTIYDVNGIARATTITGVDLATLDLSQDLIYQVAALNAPLSPEATIVQAERSGGVNEPCLDIGRLTGRLASPVELTRLPACSVNTAQTLVDREYQIVYAPLLIRGVQSGYFGVGLSRDFVISAWSSSRSAVLGITAALALASVLLGYYVARRITRPLNELVQTATAVTSGDLIRRSAVRDHNEFGQLSSAFNQMTEHLLQLYTTSRELNRSIELAAVLRVTSEAASGFAPGTETLALLEHDAEFQYYTRQAGPEVLHRLEGTALPDDHPLVLQLASQEIVENTLYLIEDEPLRAAAGLGEKDGVETLLAAPLMRQNRFVGALFFAHPEPQAFSESQQQSLAVIANMSSAVLSNAMLYTQVQQDAKQRQAILTSIGDGVVVCDRQGRIVLLNRAAEFLLGITDWQQNRLRFSDLPFEEIPPSLELFGQTVDAQFLLGDRSVTLSRAPVIAENNEIIGEVIVLHDVTESVAMDKAKTDFIATISHELRTPLTVIRGFTELLLRGTGEEKPTTDQTELLEQVRARAVEMTNMVNNAILIADIESGQLETELQPQDVEMVLGMAAVPLRHAFDNKQLRLDFDLPPDLPLVLADREQLKRAFSQLLDNALRYTDQGGVTVRAFVDDQGHIQIHFQDTGQGIAPDILPRLFKRFQRIEGNNSAQRGGGLGLAITKQLIERLGGKVGVVSTPGQGSTFIITLLEANEQSLAVAQSSQTASS